MLIKKLFSVIFLLLFFAFSVDAVDDTDIKISAESAVVINADTSEIIFDKNSFLRNSMASTTKIMTSLIAIESGLLSQKVIVQDEIQSEGTSIGLKKGDELTLESLVYGMMLESGNDAAEITAEYFSGNEERFSDLMNKKGRSIGMSNTNFVTASGLDSEEHYSTAYDMAILGAYAVKNPVFKRICSLNEKSVEFIKPEYTATFSNHNKLLQSCEGVFGVKTGFTKKSGRCLVSACEREGVTLVAVTLNAYDDWNDHKKLYDECYKTLNAKDIALSLPDEIKIYGAENKTVSVDAETNIYRYAYMKEKSVSVRTVLPRLVYAPVSCGDVLGEIQVVSDEKVLFSSDITVQENIAASEGREHRKGFIEKIKESLNKFKH